MSGKPLSQLQLFTTVIIKQENTWRYPKKIGRTSSQNTFGNTHICSAVLFSSELKYTKLDKTILPLSGDVKHATPTLKEL